MIEKIHERVSVLAVYNREGSKLMIHKIRWNGRCYHINQLGYHHKARAGRIILHYFHVVSDTIAFKLEFDPEHLTWHVVEVSDGAAN